MAPDEFRAGHRACPRSSSVDSTFRPKQIILVTTLLDPNAIQAKLAQLYHLRDGSQFQAPQNHVKHGDDLGKITADGTKGNLDASTGLQFAAKLDVDIG